MTLGEPVEYYVDRLSGANAEDAWHALVELGPLALPHVIAAFHATSHLDTQVLLVSVIGEYRTVKSVPFLAGLLSHPAIWKSAIDALVTAGCRAAVEALVTASAAAPDARREWIDEAIPQAMASLTEAAERGDVGAQCDLGIIYAKVRGVAAETPEARTWIRRAAEQGHAEAQYYLGDTSDEEEQEEAVEWLRQAGEQGHVAAQFALAWKYEGTDGVGADAEEAVTWLRRAAERGHADAQRLLGGHYASGYGVAQDDTEAVGWLRKAAEQGNAAAQFELGEMFAVGRGVPQDDMQAAVWICKAGECGDDLLRYKLVDRYEKASATAREAMEQVMSSEQRANVQRQLREWREDFENRHGR